MRKAWLLSILLSILILSSCSDIVDSGSYESETRVPSWIVGNWKLIDENGNPTNVILYQDGSVLGTNDTIGSWYYIDGYLYINWMSGWVDVIHQEGNGYKKSGFAPGVAIDSPPTNQSKA